MKLIPLRITLAFKAAALFFFSPLPSHAELSGAVDLGGGSAKPSEQAQTQPKQIAVTGIGTNPESAEKQAVTDAVRQAVGAYVDANTLVQNEEVIKDRILSVSNGFVKEYKVVSPAKQREDGLYEVQILAMVETTQVINAIKKNNLISGEVAGSDMWAQASTKVMNTQDALAMLQAKMPEWIKSSVTITPLGEDGKPLLGKDGKPSTAPAAVQEDAVTGKATLRWYLELGLDKKYYKETILPPLEKCINAITGISPKEVTNTFYSQTNKSVQVFAGETPNSNRNNPPWPAQLSPIKFISVDIINCRQPYNDEFPALFKSFSRNFDSYNALIYPGAKQRSKNLAARSALQRENFMDDPGAVILSYLQLKLLDSNGDVIALQNVKAWQPFVFDGGDGSFIAAGPNITCLQGHINLLAPVIVVPKIEVGIDLLKEIKSVEVTVEVPEFQLSLSN